MDKREPDGRAGSQKDPAIQLFAGPVVLNVYLLNPNIINAA